MQVPFLFKYAVDALSMTPEMVATNSMAIVGLGTPVVLLLAYGLTRAGAAACNGKF